MAAPGEFECMSSEELGQWLTDKGFDEDVAKAFVDQGMDGEAVSLAYATISGPDCLKEVISKYGMRLKVYQTIKDALFAENRELEQKTDEDTQSDSPILLSETEDVQDVDNNLSDVNLPVKHTQNTNLKSEWMSLKE